MDATPGLRTVLAAGDVHGHNGVSGSVATVALGVHQLRPPTAGPVVIGGGVRGSKILVDGAELASLPCARVLPLTLPTSTA